MVQSQKIHLAPERRLAMTFQLSQALKILQMSHLELKEYIQEEIEKNPLLEEVKKKTPPPIDCEIASSSTTYETLTAQMREIFSEKKELSLALKIGEFLDEKGFLSTTTDEIAKNIGEEKEQIDKILASLQTLEPPGIFARNLQESLLLQLKAKGIENSVVYTLIEENYDDLLHHRYSLLKKKYKNLDLSEAIQKLALLQLRPLESIKKEFSSPIIPDVYIRLRENNWAIGMMDEEIPRFRIDTKYQELQSENKEEQQTINLWITSGKWLLKTLRRRKEILLKLTLKLAQIQKEYLSQKGTINPLSMQELAESLHVHQSTISRALSGKYVETPIGTILLKSLITNSPEKKEAKKILQEIVSHENKSSPLTDDELAVALHEKGYKVARRTISKYRKELKISPTQSRKLV